MDLNLAGFGLLLCYFWVNVAAQFHPYKEGTYMVRNISYEPILLQGLTHYLDVWAPDEPGTFPVVLFQSGFAGSVPGVAHSIFLERIASHGYLVLAPWTTKRLMLLTEFEGHGVTETLDWAENHLLRKLQDEEDFDSELIFDFGMTYYSGHSSGNHILVNNLKHYGCQNVKGLAMISPVDGLDPYGFFQGFCIEPGQKLNFVMPTLIMAAGYDWKPARNAPWAACGPEELSNTRFWDAMNGVGWFINNTDYGHVDFQDDSVIDLNAAIDFCSTKEPPAPLAVYRNYVPGQVIAFLKGLEGKCEAFDYLELESLIPINVSALELRGDSSTVCGNPVCTWQPEEAETTTIQTTV